MTPFTANDYLILYLVSLVSSLFSLSTGSVRLKWWRAVVVSVLWPITLPISTIAFLFDYDWPEWMWRRGVRR